MNIVKMSNEKYQKEFKRLQEEYHKYRQYQIEHNSYKYTSNLFEIEKRSLNMIKKVSRKFVSDLVDKWCRIDNGSSERFTKEEKGLFYCFSDSRDEYIAIDNTSGDCFVEEFCKETSVIKYLKNDYEDLSELFKEDRS